LETYKHYEKVNLGWNEITPKGLTAICGRLSKFKFLKELVLNRNKLGSSREGLDCLMVLLRKTPSISVVILKNNNINDGDAQVIAQTLSNLKGLYKLDLRHNSITSVGAKALLTAVSNNGKTCELDLYGNTNIDHAIFTELKKVLKAN
jgi:Ran GTPase-activating protein (RanGAP) involved in mRNA processing and transport